MAGPQFRALVVDRNEAGLSHEIRSVTGDLLPRGEVTIEVRYSGLNYKDGLAVTGKGKVLRQFPIAPGIDLAGVVVESDSPEFHPGDEVLSTGWGLGQDHWGGFSEVNRLPAQWLTPLPTGLSLKRAMAVGTAGFTAMLCLDALERYGLKAGNGPVLVTGAGGGVGGMAIVLLANLGYQVAACTGRAEIEGYLRELGAYEVIGRGELDRPAKGLESERWAGAIDTVGGRMLATLLTQMKYHAGVAACGLASSPDLPATVFPFILRGVALLGVESVTVPPPLRRMLWARIAKDVPAAALDLMTETIPLDQVPAESERLIAGGVRGRLVVDIRG